MNPNESTLIPVNKKFFEDIDNYIIPLSEILARAYDLEKKMWEEMKIGLTMIEGKVIVI